ncbi:MAG: hypothetical protein NC078_08365, partial [Ruminococcus sp.]|nr:hypothetical protein [Ruminococcus sp.]
MKNTMSKAFILTAVILLMLSGCQKAENAAEPADSPETAEISEAEETDVSEDVSRDVSETAETEETKNTAADDTADPSKPVSRTYDSMSPEDRELTDRLKEGGMLALYPDGNIGVSEMSEEDIYSLMSVKYLLSEEIIESMVEEGAFSSREEYLEYINEYFPEAAEMTDEKGNITGGIDKAVYITLSGNYYGNDEDGGEWGEEYSDNAFYLSAGWLLDTLRDKENAAALIKTSEEEGYSIAEAHYYWEEDGVICAQITAGDWDESVELAEKFHISGRPGVMIGDNFIFADTEILALTSRDKWIFQMLAGDFLPEEYELICADEDAYYDEDLTVDLAEVKEKLPGLREIYMYQANVTNIEALGKMENLQVLSYYANDDTSIPFAALGNLKSLRLYGDYKDYSFLNGMDGLEELHVTYDGSDRGELESLFGCSKITSLEIDAWGGDMDLDLSGIEKLTNLKKLDITGSDIDFAPISKLPSLEDFHVRCTSGEKNVDTLKNAPKLKTLFLSDLEIFDWDFLADMPALEDLALYYTPYVSNSDIAPLKNLKSLTLCEAGCDSGAVKGLENLERFSCSLYSGYQDYSALADCKNLK